MWLSGSSCSRTLTWVIYTAVIHTTAVGIRVKTMGLRLWFPGSVSNQPCGEGGCLGRYHRLHLWLRISTCSHASEGVWGELSPPLPAWGPWHQGVTAATSLQIIREQPRKNLASLGIFVASPAKYSCKNSFPLDSGREVLAATAGRGRGKGVGREACKEQHPLPGTMPCRAMPYHAVPCRATPCCAVIAVVKAGAGSGSLAEARQRAACRSYVGCRCEAGEAGREETWGLPFLSADHSRLPPTSVELMLPSRWLRGEELQLLRVLIEWFLNTVPATECRPRAGCLARPETVLDQVLSLANAFCLAV